MTIPANFQKHVLPTETKKPEIGYVTFNIFEAFERSLGIIFDSLLRDKKISSFGNDTISEGCPIGGTWLMMRSLLIDIEYEFSGQKDRQEWAIVSISVR
jgi:hypothetical protein